MGTNNKEEVVIEYAIPGNDAGGRLFVYGNSKAKHVVVFCAGFPDDCSTFQPLARRLAAEDPNYLCGVTCLPGYDNHHDNFKKDGYTFDEIVASLREATKILRNLATNNSCQLTGVFHDWGSLFGAMCATRMNQEVNQYFANLVYFDVLPPAPKSLQIPRAKLGFRNSVIMSSYMALFAASFGIQRYLSHYMAAPVMSIGFGVIKLLGLAPTGKLDTESFQKRKPQPQIRKLIYMMYPYYYLYKRIFAGKKPLPSDCHIPANVNETPVLYLYGPKKNIAYHDANQLNWLKKQGGKTKVVEVANAGHWLYLQQPDICYQEVKKFIEG